MQRHCWSCSSSTIVVFHAVADAEADAALYRFFWNGSTNGAAVDNCMRRHCWSCSSSTIITVDSEDSDADVAAALDRYF